MKQQYSSTFFTQDKDICQKGLLIHWSCLQLISIATFRVSARQRVFSLSAQIHWAPSASASLYTAMPCQLSSTSSSRRETYCGCPFDELLCWCWWVEASHPSSCWLYSSLGVVCRCGQLVTTSTCRNTQQWGTEWQWNEEKIRIRHTWTRWLHHIEAIMSKGTNPLAHPHILWPNALSGDDDKMTWNSTLKAQTNDDSCCTGATKTTPPWLNEVQWS